MINIVDEYMASKTILLKEISNSSCIVNLVWKENLLLLSYNFELDDDLKILSFEVMLEDDEIVCIKKVIREYIEKIT
jgi:hypothetical protein